MEEIEWQKEYLRRLTVDNIDGVNIPASLGEAFTELDQGFPEVDRNEMSALPEREDMIAYHLGLGMWMRNNWRLHGGSRLKQYFLNHGVRDAEEMSTIVLFFYYDLLTGKKGTWKEWEKDPVKWKVLPND